MPVNVLPDIVGTVIDFLDAAVTEPVSGALPSDFVPPAVRVQRVGGLLDQPSNHDGIVGPDIADLSVHCWADTDHDADRLAATVRAHMHTLPGATTGVSSVREVGAPQLLTDESRPKPTPRVVMTFAVVYR